MGHFISSKPLQMNFIISEIERLDGLRVKRWLFTLANPRGMLGSISLIFMHFGGGGNFFPNYACVLPSGKSWIRHCIFCTQNSERCNVIIWSHEIFWFKNWKPLSCKAALLFNSPSLAISSRYRYQYSGHPLRMKQKDLERNRDRNTSYKWVHFSFHLSILFTETVSVFCNM